MTPQLLAVAQKAASCTSETICQPSECGNRYNLYCPQSMPKASTFLWNQNMLLQVNCRGYVVAKYMDVDVSQYSYAPNIEARTFFQPEQPFYAHHPGRFFYLLDNDTNELFSAPYEPVRNIPKSFTFSAGASDARWYLNFDGITVEVKVELAEDDVLEIWSVKLKNESSKRRSLKLFPYFTIGFMSWMNQSARFDEDLNALIAECVTPYQKLDDYARVKTFKDKTFLLCEKVPQGWETGRERFEGEGGLSNPDGIRNGLSNKVANYESPVGVVQHDVLLDSNEVQDFKFLFGPAQTTDDIKNYRDRYFGQNVVSPHTPSKLEREIVLCKQQLQISSPDAKFDNFVNNWLPRQLFLHGETNRLTHDPQTRNYLQDNMGMSYLYPEVMKKALCRTLSQQNLDGSLPDGVLLNEQTSLKYINQVPHTDHNIWLPVCLEVYLNETADYDILDLSISSVCGTHTATIGQRITLAMKWLINNRDERGLSLISQGDWCDPMNMVGPKGKGVSGWLTIATAHAVHIWSKILKHVGHNRISEQMLEAYDSLKLAAQTHLWDETWFVRGISDEGKVFGKASDDEGKIFLNPQSWAILANIVSDDQRESLLASIDTHLITPYGPEMLTPPFTRMHEHIGRVTQKFPGSSENGSVYNHAAIFYIYSLYKIEDADRAFKLLKAMLPGESHADLIQRGQLPIFIPNYYRGAYKLIPDMAGRSSQMFNTGTVSWYYRCVLEGLVGFEGHADGVSIRPCLPSDWNYLQAQRKFRGANFDIKIERGSKKEIRVNGELIKGSDITDIKSGETYNVLIKI
ncbi:MAG: NdvB protein [Maricaulaceae bacterium]